MAGSETRQLDGFYDGTSMTITLSYTEEAGEWIRISAGDAGDDGTEVWLTPSQFFAAVDELREFQGML